MKNFYSHSNRKQIIGSFLFCWRTFERLIEYELVHSDDKSMMSSQLTSKWAQVKVHRQRQTFSASFNNKPKVIYRRRRTVARLQRPWSTRRVTTRTVGHRVFRRTRKSTIVEPSRKSFNGNLSKQVSPPSLDVDSFRRTDSSFSFRNEFNFVRWKTNFATKTQSEQNPLDQRLEEKRRHSRWVSTDATDLERWTSNLLVESPVDQKRRRRFVSRLRQDEFSVQIISSRLQADGLCRRPLNFRRTRWLRRRRRPTCRPELWPTKKSPTTSNWKNEPADGKRISSSTIVTDLCRRLVRRWARCPRKTCRNRCVAQRRSKGKVRLHERTKPNVSLLWTRKIDVADNKTTIRTRRRSSLNNWSIRSSSKTKATNSFR